jgi:hypothetical protein
MEYRALSRFLANDLMWSNAPSILLFFADFGYCAFPFFAIVFSYVRPAQADCLVFPRYASSPTVEGFAPFPLSFRLIF